MNKISTDISIILFCDTVISLRYHVIAIIICFICFMLDFGLFCMILYNFWQSLWMLLEFRSFGVDGKIMCSFNFIFILSKFQQINGFMCNLIGKLKIYLCNLWKRGLGVTFFALLYCSSNSSCHAKFFYINLQ